MAKKGFTLIELLVVISIIALLSSVVLASLGAARDKARVTAIRQFDAQIYRAAADQAGGLWDFDECAGTTAADRSDNGSAGTFTNGPVWSTDTPYGVGCSLQLDGVNDYVYVPDTDGADFGPYEDFTISFWMKTTGSSNAKPIAKYNVDTSGAGWGFYRAGDQIRLKVGNGTSVVYEVGTGSVNDGSWRHIVFSVQRTGSCSRYRDGVMVGATSCSSWAAADLSNSNGMYFGMNTTLTAPWGGSLDDIRIYKKTLTASEVGAIYAQGAARLLAAQQ